MKIDIFTLKKDLGTFEFEESPMFGDNFVIDGLIYTVSRRGWRVKDGAFRNYLLLSCEEGREDET